MIDITLLYNILLKENVSLYENEIFELIPELKFEKNFEQRNEWHCFDVWHHTLATIEACDMNAEDRLIMLLHDIGKPFSYQDDGEIRHFKGHADKSADISKEVLSRFNIPEEIKEVILQLIRYHSSAIKVENIDLDNLEFYKRLLKIKICDAKGYEIEHSKKVIDRLEKTSIKINTIK